MKPDGQQNRTNAEVKFQQDAERVKAEEAFLLVGKSGIEQFGSWY